jgi:TonB family protein
VARALLVACQVQPWQVMVMRFVRDIVSARQQAAGFPLVGLFAKSLLLGATMLHPAIASAAEPRLLQAVPPEYPPAALRKQQQGWVEVEFTVGVDGKVRDAAVVKSEPPRVFDREAVRAIQRSSFEPANEGGKPVEARARRKVEFRL